MDSKPFPYVVHSRLTFADEEEDIADSLHNSYKSKSPSKERIITLTISKIEDKNSNKNASFRRRPMNYIESTIGDFPPYQNIPSFRPLSSIKETKETQFRARKNVKPKPLTQTVTLYQEENIVKPEDLKQEIVEINEKPKRLKSPKPEMPTQTDSRYLTPRSKQNSKSSNSPSKSSFNRTSQIKPNTSIMRMSELDTPEKPNKSQKNSTKRIKERKDSSKRTPNTNTSKKPQKSPSKTDNSQKPINSKFTISRQTEADQKPVTVQEKISKLSVFDSIQVNIEPEEEFKSPKKVQITENQENDDNYILKPPQETYKVFSPHGKSRTISKASKSKDFHVSFTNVKESQENTQIEHTQTMISPMRKSENNFSNARRFDTGFLPNIVHGMTNEEEEEDFLDEELLSPQKLAPLKEVDDEESLAEFLKTEEKLKQEISRN